MAKKAPQKPQQAEGNDVKKEGKAPLGRGSADAEAMDAEAMDAERATRSERDSAEGNSVEEPAVEPRSKRPRMGSSERAAQEEATLCVACRLPATTPGAGPALQCGKCQETIHALCYFRTQKTSESQTPWTCDSCKEDHTVPRDCIYCTQVGHSCMRRVDTVYWPASYLKGIGEGSTWGHALCAFWDPFNTPSPASPADAGVKEESKITETTPTDNALEDAPPQTTKPTQTSFALDFRTRLELPVPPCAYCSGVGGVRIQCRRLNCGKFFHVWCANTSEHGYIEVSINPFPLRQALCDRHLHHRHELKDLVNKLTSKTMASLVPRDIASKVQAIARRADTYSSIDDFIAEIINVLVEMSKKGLKNSKNDPPTFSMRQLQAVQLVLDHLPQLRNIYDRVTLSKSDSEFVQDADVFLALQRAFHPQRYVRKFAGPLSQFYHCDMCREPFQDRQHIFYCTSSEQTHALHWKCTKRKSAAKESRQGGSSSSKKKLKAVSLVQQGHWKDVKLPKGLPSVGEGITCGVCRAPVDGRGILASRKETTRLEFDKPTSDFMFGGCFANEMDARTAAAAGLKSSRATMMSAAQSLSTVNGNRAGTKTAPRRSSSMIASGQQESECDVAAMLGPPKMDRINVRRTTRWLACLGQVIRLVLASNMAPRAEESDNRVGRSIEESAQAEPAGTDGSAIVCVVKSSSSNPREGEIDAEPQSSDTKTEEVLSTQQDAAMHPIKRDTVGDTERGSSGAETAVSEQTQQIKAQPSSLPSAALPYLEEAKSIVRPFDAYALSKMEAAHKMFNERNGPALSVLSTLIQEYTRFMYIKHTRAVEKATNEKRKRQELEAQEERERERKRIDREAELALKKQMLAMRKKQRQ